MSAIFIVEDGTAKTDANSYVSEAYASTYFDGHIYASAWVAAASTVQKNALITATRLLDEWINWDGYRATEDQALRFPRYDIIDRDGYAIDSNIVPEFVKRAVCEEALALLQSNLMAEPDTKGYSELRAGSLSMKIDKQDRDNTGALPDQVLAIIEFYGQVRRRGSGGTVILERA